MAAVLYVLLGLVIAAIAAMGCAAVRRIRHSGAIVPRAQYHELAAPPRHQHVHLHLENADNEQVAAILRSIRKGNDDN
jgi:hypothetical protein